MYQDAVEPRSTAVEAKNHLPEPYSASFENRILLLLEMTTLTRALVPSSMPLLVRIAGSDWMAHIPSASAFHIN